MRRKRRQPPVQIILRLYPGPDDDLLRWLDELDEQVMGAKTRALKEALRRGLQARDMQASSVPVEFDLAQVRQVVEAAVVSAIRDAGLLFQSQGQRVQVGSAAGEDDEVESLLDALQDSLVLSGDE